MSLHLQTKSPFSARSDGIVPFECSYWEGKPLFIIKGSIKGGGVFATVHGKAYRYEDFPWPKGEKISKEKCREIACENNRFNGSLWVSDSVYKQFEKILEQEKLNFG